MVAETGGPKSRQRPPRCSLKLLAEPDCDAGAVDAAMLGHLHAPGPQARPLRLRTSRGVRRLVERRAGVRHHIGALDVGLARLIARRG
jgi:hypothetical protein